MIKKFFIIVVLNISMLQMVFGQTFEYRVIRGDTLSEVAYRFNLLPLYGKNGSVRNLINLNKELEKSDGNKIFPGQIILIPLDPPKEESYLEEKEGVRMDTAKIKTNEESSSIKGSYLSVSLGSSYLEIASKDKINKGTARFTSDYNMGLKLNWETFFSPNKSIKIHYGLNHLSFQHLGGGRRLAQHQAFLHQFGARGKHIVKEKLYYGLALDFKDRVFFKAKDESVLNIEKVNIISPSVFVGYNLIQTTKLRLGLEGNTGFLLSAKTENNTINNGFSAELLSYLSYNLNKKKTRFLKSSIFYNYSKQDTNLVDQSSSERGVIFSYVQSLGE